ncbi:MAG: ribonuclease P protein component [Solobacterium sp.]|jgi:ribonuclease P protein component|nr:ribonuclease P protein component [Solobacterium sp.]MCH4205398.1 ribonuclease P protein component [Solobacterium sp.]MCH4226610.1 ribonuclease P protein component [Solobacterium sp.]MCH4282085.1 ribonuclease P protein component [Solobacterium sp.]
MKKKNRVRKAEEFQDLVHKGSKYVNSSFVLYTKDRKEEQARIGITLSKKIGIAVKRNLYKRQVRMMCQDLVDFRDCTKDAVLIVRFGYLNQSYEANKKNLEKLFIKATIK